MIAVAASLFAVALVGWLHERNIHVLRRGLGFLHRPLGEVRILLVCIVGLMHYGAMNSLLGHPMMMAPREMQQELLSEPETSADFAGMEVEVYATDELLSNSWFGVGAANNIITNWTFPATFTIADTVYFCVTNNGHYSVFAETNLVSAGRIYMGANEYHAIKGVFSMATLSNAPVEVLANIYAISNSLNNIRHLSMLHPDSPYCHSFSWRKNIWLHTTFASTNRLEISERILIGQ